MARAVARKKGGRRAPRRVSLRKRVAKKRTAVRRVQRKPRKMVYRKRAQPRRKVRIAKPKVRKAPAQRVVHRGRAAKKVPILVPPAAPVPILVPPAAPVPKMVSDPRRRKEIVNLVLEEIRNNGGSDVRNRFRDSNGNMGLTKISLKSTESASGTYIGSAQVVYNNEIVKVFIKMFITEELNEYLAPTFSLLTEACISNEISQNKYPNIPTLMNSYGVLYSTQLVDNFYGNIQFDLPTHENVRRAQGVRNDPFHPVYFINEMSDELGSPAVTLTKFIQSVKVANIRSNDYVRSLFFMRKGMEHIRKDIYAVFVQLMVTLKLMHDAGLYHNDIHGGNIFVVQLAQPTYLTIGNITMLTNYVVRVYDWDRSFSNQCNPLTENKMLYAGSCQSAREPSKFGPVSCYQPHEQFSWGDSWLVIYTFILGNMKFDDPDIDIINSRARELINRLTNMNYNGNFWSERHGIDFDQLIANLKPEHLAQIRS